MSQTAASCGQPDTRDLDKLSQVPTLVERGAVLATLRGGTPGSPGLTVFNETLAFNKTVSVQPVLHANIAKRGKKFVAEVKGIFLSRGNDWWLLPVLQSPR